MIRALRWPVVPSYDVIGTWARWRVILNWRIRLLGPPYYILCLCTFLMWIIGCSIDVNVEDDPLHLTHLLWHTLINPPLCSFYCSLNAPVYTSQSTLLSASNNVDERGSTLFIEGSTLQNQSPFLSINFFTVCSYLSLFFQFYISWFLFILLFFLYWFSNFLILELIFGIWIEIE